MSYISELKARVEVAEAEREHLRSLLEAFFSGEVPEVASLQHHILAKWGRKRIEDMRKKPAILQHDNP